jgi:calcineurin-like phosphoesterase family protein
MGYRWFHQIDLTSRRDGNLERCNVTNTSADDCRRDHRSHSDDLLPTAMSDLFFTADEHYGHRNIIDFCKRPFSSIEEMKETIIERHNKKVPRGGRVIHIGDMFWRTFGLDAAHEVLSRLNGQQYYVYGNHDELIEGSKQLQDRFVYVKDVAEIKVDKLPKIVAFHYALRVWNGSHRGSWHLYGHSHGDLPENGSLSFDVGVDCWNFEPVSLEEVCIKMLPKMEAMSARDLKRKAA